MIVNKSFSANILSSRWIETTRHVYEKNMDQNIKTIKMRLCFSAELSYCNDHVDDHMFMKYVKCVVS